MRAYEAATYGERIAEVYDTWYRQLDPAAAVGFLAELAELGPVLELGIGTGRLALPLLTQTHVPLHGIDASKNMVERLRAKPHGDAVRVTLGDFADVNVAGMFQLVYVAFNTFFALLAQDDQVRCFRNVAARLKPDGVFVIEAFVPDPSRFDRGQRVECTPRVQSDHVMLTVSQHDPVRQRVDSQHVVFSEQGARFYPVCVRYAWPAELDLMARLADLRLRERWGGWKREPFNASCGHHVSVYEHNG